MSFVRAVRFRLGGVVLLSFLTAFVGCGRAPGTVSGKVTYQGQPVTSGAVIIFGADGNADSGRIDHKGDYTVHQAPSGPVKVVVIPGKPARTMPALPLDRATGRPKEPPAKDRGGVLVAPPPGKGDFPQKYQDPDQSGLTFTVRGGRKQAFDIALVD